MSPGQPGGRRVGHRHAGTGGRGHGRGGRGGWFGPCFFEVYFPPLTTIGPETFIYDLLERAGCDPTTAGAKTDYPTWSVEKLIEGQPAVYLATPNRRSRPTRWQAAGVRRDLGRRSGAVVLVDSDLITRPGPRVIDGLEALEAALHPPD